MKTINYLWLKGFNMLLAGLLILLGFTVTSCETSVEYGTPHAEFEVKGKVTDQTGKPISGIEVKYAIGINNKNVGTFNGEMVSHTDKNGTYQATFKSWPDHRLRITAADVDGPENGSFQTDSIDVKVGEFEGKEGGWYYGKAVVEAPTIQLKEKEEQKE